MSSSPSQSVTGSENFLSSPPPIETVNFVETFFQTRDYIKILETTLYRLADPTTRGSHFKFHRVRETGLLPATREENAVDHDVLSGLQALASVNRKTREILGGRPDLVTARAVFRASDSTCTHEQSAFNAHGGSCPKEEDDDSDDEECYCHTKKRTGCPCDCHATCMYCSRHGEVSHLLPGVENAHVSEEACRDFQRFQIALYEYGNLSVASFYHDCAVFFKPIVEIVRVEDLIQQSHIELARHFLDRGCWTPPYHRNRSDAKRRVCAALLCRPDRVSDALDLVSPYLKGTWSEDVLIRDAVYDRMGRHPFTAETLKAVVAKFPGMYSDHADKIMLFKDLVGRIYPDMCGYKSKEGIEKWQGILDVCLSLPGAPLASYFDEIITRLLTELYGADSEYDVRLLCMDAFLFIAKRMALVAEKGQWKVWLRSSTFAVLNRRLLKSTDYGARDLELREKCKVQFCELVETREGFKCHGSERTSIENALFRQQSLLDYMNFVAEHIDEDEDTNKVKKEKMPTAGLDDGEGGESPAKKIKM